MGGQDDYAFLHPEYGDDIGTYLHQPAINRFTGKSGVALQKKPNGECVYLNESGCSIYERAPWTCRIFDCRKLSIEAMAKGFVPIEVVRAGRERLGGSRHDG